MKKPALQLLIIMFCAAALNAQSLMPANARLVVRSGVVEVQRGNTWLSVAPGDSLNPGERIRTGNGSSAALEIGAGQVVALGELSQIQLHPSPTSPVVQLESGSMKVFSAPDIQAAGNDTILQPVDPPADLEIGYTADQLNLTGFNGTVGNGAVAIGGGYQDPGMRIHPVDERSFRDRGPVAENPTFYVYPYWYGHPDPNAGAIVPPVVNNPTHPAYRPTQIVPPMSDPLRVPVMPPQPARRR